MGVFMKRIIFCTTIFALVLGLPIALWASSSSSSARALARAKDAAQKSVHTSNVPSMSASASAFSSAHRAASSSSSSSSSATASAIPHIISSGAKADSPEKIEQDAEALAREMQQLNAKEAEETKQALEQIQAKYTPYRIEFMRRKQEIEQRKLEQAKQNSAKSGSEEAKAKQEKRLQERAQKIKNLEDFIKQQNALIHKYHTLGGERLLEKGKIDDAARNMTSKQTEEMRIANDAKYFKEIPFNRAGFEKTEKELKEAQEELTNAQKGYLITIRHLHQGKNIERRFQPEEPIDRVIDEVKTFFGSPKKTYHLYYKNSEQPLKNEGQLEDILGPAFYLKPTIHLRDY